MIQFDFDDRHRDEPSDRGMPWFARVLIADLAFNVIFGIVVVPWLIILALIWPDPKQAVVPREEETPLVFLQPEEIPKILLRERPPAVAEKPVVRPEIVLPGNTRPFEPGPPPVEAPSPTPTTPEPAPAEASPGPQPEPQLARNASPIAAPPRIEEPVTPRVGGGLRDALKNFDRYASATQTGANPLGGATDSHDPDFDFDRKGVDFGPWLRRFVSQVRRNWFVPLSAQTFRGRVVVTMIIHRDGRITELHVVKPSNEDSFNLSSYNALRGSNPTEPLPVEYPDRSMRMTVTFYYNEPPGS